MTVKLHRCSATWYKRDNHACWRVEKALRDANVEYGVVKVRSLPRGARKAVIAGTGQSRVPALELEDGTWYRADSTEMAERIRAGELFGPRPAGGEETLGVA